MKNSKPTFTLYSRLISLSGLILTLSACVSSVYQPLDSNIVHGVSKDIAIPKAFEAHTRTTNTETTNTVFQLDTDSLLNGFASPELQSLIQQGLENNPQLAISKTLISDARARAYAANSQRYPNLNINSTVGRSKNQLGTNSFTSDTYNLGFSSQWELDIWKKLKDQSKAAYLELTATENDLVFAQLSLAANISRAYFNLLTQQELLEQTRKSTSNIESLEGIAVRSLKRGLVTVLDVQLARRDLANAKRAMIAQDNVVNEAARTLNLLLGEYPNAVKTRQSFSNEKLPSLDSVLAEGIPSDVLTQRPDLLATAVRLDAAGLQINVSRKNFLPRISLTGSGGTSSTELSGLLDKDFSVWSLLSNLSYPLLNRQALRSNLVLSENSLERLTYTYANQVLNAFNEVESGLDNEGSLREQLLALTQARNYAHAASERAKQSYEKGLVDANTLLATELQALTAEQNLIRTKNFLLQNRINLVLALGGGLKTEKANALVASEPE